ncbi:MAG: 2-oxo acid dehydrogenase subunit E2 [Candidatus Rokuibacteriota bacterium]|nr:MAG: 2-oxo acid dehydrogenase subunit E2 [Candidatus Rokubacteria bacterium]
MAQFEFKLPDIGEGVVEGEIVKWLVKAGDEIAEDQPLVEVMTDKATVTIPSPRKGKVLQTLGNEGDTAKVHQTLVVLEVDGAGVDVGQPHAPPTAQSAPPLPPEHAGSPAPLATAPGPGRVEQVPSPRPQARGGGVDAPQPMSSGFPSYGQAPAARGLSGNGEQRAKVLATPVTRKMARDMGVDLGSVHGTGPLGRVMKTDVLAYVEQQRTPPPEQSQLRGPSRSQPRPAGGEERIPLRGLRKRIAEAMVKSKSTAPHFTFVEETNTKALTSLRARLNERLAARGEPKLSYLPFIAKALVAAFRKFPHLNAVMDEAKQELVVKSDVNLGFGAATDQGLTVFVVKNVESFTLREVGAEIDRLSKAAREQRLAIHELQGGTFTITSLGKDGGMLATPIIHHPEVAILGVHKIKKTPVVIEDEDGRERIEIGERMNLSCSFDHRVIDGHVGAAFLYEVIRELEAPELLLMDS